MFTGIVEELGTIVSVTHTARGDDAAARLLVEAPLVTSDAAPGDSIAVSGVCLTVVDVASGCFTADVMRETLIRSSLVDARARTRVNLERAVTPTTRLGGHIVQGHVDGVGAIVGRKHTPAWDVVTIAIPSNLSRYIAEKGSIAVDGVSLTVVNAGAEEFTVSLIPTTLHATTLGIRQLGGVNIEVDVMAKYAERLLAARDAETTLT